jgi:single-stranded DNA-binding protein
MFNVNRATLLGHATEDARQTNGQTVIGLATIHKRNGETETTDHHRLLCTGALAEFAVRQVKAGSPLYVEGRLHTEKETVILVDRLVLLSTRK